MRRFRGPNEVFGCATNLPAPPTDADSSVRLRATGSDTPWLEGFADVLPQSTAGSNSAARLEVVFLRGLFSSPRLQIRGLKFQSSNSKSRELELTNLLGLVLGGIEAKFCK